MDVAFSATSAGASVHVRDSQTDVVVGAIRQLIIERRRTHQLAVSVMETLLERPDISSFAQKLLKAIEASFFYLLIATYKDTAIAFLL